MSALRNVEDTIGGFVERVFGRMFRGHVEPVELARKLAREMEDHKTVSVTRVYVPNEYVVYLAPSDRERFASFEGALTTELGVYVAERARHEGFTLLSPPQVRLETDADLRVGEYGIACRVVDPPAEHEPPVEVDAATPEPQPELTRFRPAPPVVPAPVPIVSPPADATPESAQADAVMDDDGAPVVDDRHDGEPPAVDDDASAAGDSEAESESGAVASSDEEEPNAVPPVVAAAAPAGLVPVAVPGAGAAIPDDADPQPPAAEPEPEPEPAVATAEPPPVVVPMIEAPAAVVPEPPSPTPLPPPGAYEPLAGVSGTQILSPAEARAEGLIQEELAFIVAGRRHPITQRTTTIGRSRDCDLVLSDANASRRHAEVRHIGLDYFIVDLGSTNGTIVNGQRVRRHALAHGDRVLIGTTELVVEHAT